MTILINLGYPYTTDILEPNLDPDRAIKINDIQLQLEAIDQAIASATLDSMAMEVGSLKVDYTRHLSLLKSEGSRLLRELGNLVGLPVYFDRFSGKSGTDIKNTQLSWVSYW